MNFYVEQLEFINNILKVLNEFEKDVDYSNGMTPQLGDIPIMLEEGLLGHLVDEIGGVWSFRPVK